MTAPQVGHLPTAVVDRAGRAELPALREVAMELVGDGLEAGLDVAVDRRGGGTPPRARPPAAPPPTRAAPRAGRGGGAPRPRPRAPAPPRPPRRRRARR